MRPVNQVRRNNDAHADRTSTSDDATQRDEGDDGLFHLALWLHARRAQMVQRA
jgi:hypothetical protein